MLQITLSGPAPELHDPTSDLFGWAPERGPAWNWQANRGHWTLDHDARGERFVLFVHGGRYVMAAVIDSVTASLCVPGRRVLNGHPLGAGDPIHDLFVVGALAAPAVPFGARNPIRYLDEADLAEIVLAARLAAV